MTNWQIVGSALQRFRAVRWRKTDNPPRVNLRSKRTHNLMRVLRRRLGLTQREVAFLLGYDSESAVSRLEKGSRIPRLPELLIIELVFGVAASAMFPHVHRTVLDSVRGRLERLRRRTNRLKPAPPRVTYKIAQLDRVLDSLRDLERPDLGGPEQPWHQPVLASKREPRKR